MSRELIVQVIDVKKDLYQEMHELEQQLLALDEQYLFAGEEKQAEKQERTLELEAKQFHVQLRLKRAQLFGLRLAKGNEPRCISCFVERNELPEMIALKSNISGTSLFKCPQCGRELRIEL